MKIATWNVNSLRVRLPHVLSWLAEHQPDVLAIQELKIPTDQFPIDDFVSAGYHAIVFGQKTYNGVATLVRENSVIDVQTGIPLYADIQSRVLALTYHDVRIINVYVPNGESIDSDKFAYKLNWFDALKQYVEAEMRAHPQLVLLGDFNIAPAEIDV